jgi:hypothetical protein
MGKTAVGLYEASTVAEQVLNDLLKAGFSRQAIRIMLGDPSTRQVFEWFDEYPVDDSSFRSEGLEGGARSVLLSVGVPVDDVQEYIEALQRGYALVSVSTTAERVGEAVDIMNRHNTFDVHERMHSWKETAL